MTINILPIYSIHSFDSLIFVGSSEGVYRSSNFGATWQKVFPSIVYTFVNKDNQIFAGANNGIYVSTDKGLKWASRNDSITIKYRIHKLAIVNDILIAGAYFAGVYKSTDYGLTWKECNHKLPNTHIRAVAIIDTTIFIGTYGNGIYFSNNYCETWTKLKANLKDDEITAFESYGNYLFVGTWGGGIYFTSDKGANWNDISGEIPDLWINSLYIYYNNFLAGTHSNWIWKRQLSEIITSVENSENSSRKNILFEQNYPNPFDSKTTIQFNILKKSFVSLKIFDTFGREIATLISQELLPDTYRFEWDASEYASGIYFSILQIGYESETLKLIILK